MTSRKELTQAAKELMKGAEIYPAPLVDLLDDDEDLEVELATSLLLPLLPLQLPAAARGGRRAARGPAQ